MMFLTVVIINGCKDESEQSGSNITLSSDSSQFDGHTISFSPEFETVVINVSADGEWVAISPSIDEWCSFSQQKGKLIVTVMENSTDFRRSSHIDFLIGGSKRRIEVLQDCERVLIFAAGTITAVGPAGATMSLPVQTNIAAELLSVTVIDPPDCDWISTPVFVNGAVSFTISENPSATAAREVTIQLSGEDKTTTITLVQKALSGYAYIIDITDNDFSDSYIYELWDNTHGIKVGEMCKEYLHKNYNGTEIVRMQATVVYPMVNGKVDLSNGLVLENGYFVAWSIEPDPDRPDRMLSMYVPGESVSERPSIFYLAKGAARMTTYPVPTTDRFAVELRPYIFRDQRSGPANNAGSTSENFTYKVVKIGCQYWMAENLRTSRFRDGTNIPTAIVADEWTANLGMPLCCLVWYDANETGNSTTNANNSSYSSYRTTYGLQYTYYAIINQYAIARDIPLVGPLEDMISPTGWHVPVKEQFAILRNYTTQSTEETGMIPELCTDDESEIFYNITGFGMMKSRYRSASSNSFNGSITLFRGMDVLYAPSQANDYDVHRAYCLRMVSPSNFTQTNHNYYSCRATAHIRCIRD